MPFTSKLVHLSEKLCHSYKMKETTEAIHIMVVAYLAIWSSEDKETALVKISFIDIDMIMALQETHDIH